MPPDLRDLPREWPNHPPQRNPLPPVFHPRGQPDPSQVQEPRQGAPGRVGPLSRANRGPRAVRQVALGRHSLWVPALPWAQGPQAKWARVVGCRGRGPGSQGSLGSRSKLNGQVLHRSKVRGRAPRPKQEVHHSQELPNNKGQGHQRRASQGQGHRPSSSSPGRAHPSSSPHPGPRGQVPQCRASQGRVPPSNRKVKGQVLPNNSRLQGLELPSSKGQRVPPSNRVLPGRALPNSRGRELPSSRGRVLPSNHSSKGQVLRSSKGRALPSNKDPVLPSSKGRALPSRYGHYHVLK